MQKLSITVMFERQLNSNLCGPMFPCLPAGMILCGKKNYHIGTVGV